MKKRPYRGDKRIEPNGFNYCRTCYRHLAGYVGVTIVEAMEKQGYLKKADSIYLVTQKGWEWFLQFDILESDYKKSRRPLTRQCVDRSEHRPHLAGQLGAVFLEKMLHCNWFEKVESSRELIVPPKGRQALQNTLGVVL